MTPLDISNRGLKHYPNIEQKRRAILDIVENADTPLFFCDRDNLSDRYRALKNSLESCWHQSVVGYSFKTNYQVAKCGLLRDLGAWAEVVSGHEYRMARALGYSGDAIIFNGPHKTDSDLTLAMNEQSIINVNDHDELDRILHLAETRSSTVSVGMRISSALPKGGLSRFGFSLENGEASEAVDKIQQSSRVHLIGLHTHLYGDTDDPKFYSVAAKSIGEFAARQIPNYQQSLRFIDMGGGFPAHSPKPKSRDTWSPQAIDVYIQHITDSLRPFFPHRESQPTLIVEPGRYLACDAVLLLTRVVHVKQRDGHQIINCNGSISMVPLTHYCPQIIRPYTRDLHPRREEKTDSTVFGATCRENDVLYQGPFPKSQTGDYLVHFAVGAYNSNLSPDFIFPTPEMVFI